MQRLFAKIGYIAIVVIIMSMLLIAIRVMIAVLPRRLLASRLKVRFKGESDIAAWVPTRTSTRTSTGTGPASTF